jgi:hypothetical protein
MLTKKSAKPSPFTSPPPATAKPSWSPEKVPERWKKRRLFMVTVNEQAEEFWEASEVLQVTVVTPMGNKDPDGGKQTTPELAQLSVAEAEKLTGTPLF